MPGITLDLSEMEDFEKELGDIPEKVLSEIDGQTGAEIRQLMSTTAKNMAPSNRYKAGGTLRQMIDSSDKGFSLRDGDHVKVGITSNAKYSIYVEYGTGNRGDPKVPHTTKTHWVYRDDEDNVFRMGKPFPARHFMEPALDDNVDSICEIIAGNIEEVFEQ